MIVAAKEVGHPCSHPLKMVACTQYNQNIRSSLKATVDAYIAQIQTISVHTQRLVQILGEKQPASFEDLQRLSSIADNLACWYDMPAAWAKTTSPQFYFEEVGKLAQHSITANNMEQQLLSNFDPSFLDQDIECCRISAIYEAAEHRRPAQSALLQFALPWQHIPPPCALL